MPTQATECQHTIHNMTLRGPRTHVNSAWGQATPYPSYAILDAQSGTPHVQALSTATTSQTRCSM